PLARPSAPELTSPSDDRGAGPGERPGPLSRSLPTGVARPRTGPGPGDHLRRLRVPRQGARRPRSRGGAALRALPPPFPAPLQLAPRSGAPPVGGDRAEPAPRADPGPRAGRALGHLSIEPGERRAAPEARSTRPGRGRSGARAP